VTDPNPDYYLGHSEGTLAHWGGEPRKVFVIGHPKLATGEVVDLVRVDPAIPRSNGAPLDELIVMSRYPGYSLDRLGDGAIIVNLIIPIDGVDIRKAAFVDGDLTIQFWADAAASPELLPKPIDVPASWALTLTRICGFIEEHGHSRVPDPYFDDVGRLDVIVGNLRWHHAGRAGISPGPFPGIDYAAELDRLPGWEW
jgi:hypothetical protein